MNNTQLYSQTNALVSVIVPCYNYAHFLPETLQSVLAQTYTNWECIIVNDGSTDNTEEVAMDFSNKDNRFKVYSHPNKGRSVARNLGLQKAIGEFIQFLDADDVIHPEKFEHQLKIFKNNRFIDVVYSDFFFFSKDVKNVISTNHFCKEMIDPLREILFEFGTTGFIIPIHSALFCRKIITQSDAFLTGIEGREDWMFWIDLALRGAKFSFMKHKLAFYRKHNQSTSHNAELVDYFKYRTAFIVYDKLPDDIKYEYADHCSHMFTEQIKDLRSNFNQLYSDKIFRVKRYFNKMKRKFTSIRVS